MEIERKWMVTGWPAGLEQTSVYNMDQGYISVRPTVRIRREALQGGRTALVLCFKGEGGLSREEIETEIDATLFARLEHLIGKPLIHKERRGYQLPGGLTLEVNCVDPDLPTAFWYAEVEFETEAQALAWDPAGCGLADYLHEECTGKPGSSMGDYWQHWLDMGKKLPNAPKIFNVNWFRTDDNGRFLWPGFGDNLRVLEWILKRCFDEVGADETPIGYEPKPEDINLDGCGVTVETLRQLLTLDAESWRENCAGIREYFAQFGDKLPHELRDELEALEKAFAE